jgi:hypothetical protein
MHAPRLGTNEQDKIDVCFLTQYHATTTDGRDVDRITIDILPEDVLLEIFDFLVVEINAFGAENRWRTLVHVCRKWRNVIFGSPHRLNLRLVCSDKTPVKEMLDVWPPLPIIVYPYARPESGWDNIVAALERKDRVCGITLKPELQWEMLLDAMREPFPALTQLELRSDIEMDPVVPDWFMGGSAPRLQSLLLESVPIPGLPNLLLSATDLVHLDLRHIPHSGYISPDAIVSCLSTLSRLETFCLGFRPPRSRPNHESRRLPPPTRSVLPALIRMHFTGLSEYLEDLVAQIDSPLLYALEIRLFHQFIFDTPQLIQFISRTPPLEAQDQTRVDFSDLGVRVSFPKTSSTYYDHLSLKILCRQPKLQLSSMAQIFTPSFPPSFFHKVERLYIRESSSSKLEWQDDAEDSQWLEFLRPFTAVKKLYLSKGFGPRIAPSLQQLVGGRTIEVLPALHSLLVSDELHLSGPFEEAIGTFVAARQLSNCPVVVSQRTF